jgi:hypothetical protein
MVSGERGRSEEILDPYSGNGDVGCLGHRVEDSLISVVRGITAVLYLHCKISRFKSTINIIGPKHLGGAE